MPDRVVVIPAGGLGTRIAPATGGALPKSLAPVLGRPFLYWQLRRVRALGLTRAHLCLGHGAAAVLASLDACRPTGLEVSHSTETEPLGVIGAVRAAVDVLPSRFLLLYGDVLPLPAVDRLWDLHLSTRPGATMLVAAAEGESNVDLDGDLVTVYEKGPAARPFVDIGMSLVEASSLAFLAAGRRADEGPFFGGLAARRRLAALRWPVTSPHIGDPPALRRCEAWLRSAADDAGPGPGGAVADRRP